MNAPDKISGPSMVSLEHPSERATFTVFSHSSGEAVGKRYELIDGTITKQPLSPFVDRYKVVSLTPSDLAVRIMSMDGSSFISSGVARDGTRAGMVRLKNAKGAGLARSKDDFCLSSGPGVVLLDHDVREETPPGLRLDQRQLRQVINDAFCVDVWTYAGVRYPSSSSFIQADLSGASTGLRGHHMLLFVEDASDWPRALKVMHKRLVIDAIGWGWSFVDKAGGQHVRSIVDAVVANDPARPIFCGPARLGDGLHYTEDRTVIAADGPLLDTRAAFPDLTPEEEAEYEAEVARLHSVTAALAAERRAARADTRRATVRAKAIASGMAEQDADRRAAAAVVSMARRERLDPFDEVPLADGTVVTGQDILDAPQTYQNRSVRDVQEPDYDGGRAVGKVVVTDDGTVIVTSFAHGGAGDGKPTLYVIEPPIAEDFDVVDQPQVIAHPSTASRLHENLIALDTLVASPEDFLPHVVDRWLPCEEVTLLAAHGGSGKSYVALSIAVHVVMGIPFAGLSTTAVPVLFFSAEDGPRVLRLRLRRICRALKIDPANLKGKLHLLDASDMDAALHRAPAFGGGRAETALVGELERFVRELGVGLVVVDNASDAYDDDEIKRARVRAFMRSLRTRIARPGRAVLLLAHVNKDAAKSRGGKSSEDYSGSTAWHNSARSRLSMDSTANSITISHMKANLGPTAPPVRLEWRDGAPLPVGIVDGPNADTADRGAEDKAAIAALIDDFDRRNERVPTTTHGPSSLYRRLRSHTDYPAHVDGERLVRLVREMESEGRVYRRVVKTETSKKVEVFTRRPPNPPDAVGGLGPGCAG